MSQRSQAVWRIFAFVYSLTIAAIISSVVTIIAIVWGAIDVLWQLISGRNTLSENSKPATVVTATLRWNVEMLIFATTGGGVKRLEWLPSW
ncbi:hypothetical protein [Natronocalculus amylovorans]|uniref:Uncharacterized protein n=1 Tax=Natronocalculus amylovorans TaxID=2917812 RepID=A0AAE3K9R8_9EURY|nr:hypothetical protein [Natronocalculus amylovorans]MCL9818323.1 hypothetical protein [Natronocalculus amylovorans]